MKDTTVLLDHIQKNLLDMIDDEAWDSIAPIPDVNTKKIELKAMLILALEKIKSIRKLQEKEDEPTLVSALKKIKSARKLQEEEDEEWE